MLRKEESIIFKSLTTAEGGGLKHGLKLNDNNNRSLINSRTLNNSLLNGNCGDRN